MLYKIAQLLLVLHLASRGGKSSLTRLHLFNWAFKLPDRSERLSNAAATKKLNVPAWGFDPALAIALRYARAENLITNTVGGYELTDFGRIYAEAITNEDGVLNEEKNLLNSVGKGITENMVDTVTKGWSIE